MLPYLTAFLVALIGALVLTPAVRASARAIGLLDYPDPERKLHAQATPLAGGLAVLVGVVAGVAVVALIPGAVSEAVTGSLSDLSPLLLAAVIICAVGLADDHKALRGRQKLAGQVGAVAVLIYFGFVVRNVEIFGEHFQLGLLAVPFTLFWLIGAINALNLLDGADGFATTVGIVISGTIALMAGLTGHIPEAVAACALTGALCGFLFFNFPPASIFLGDGGSMLIGLFVGVLAIRSSLKGPSTVALAAPLAILAIPIIDSAAAVVRRVLTGRSLYVPDRGHLHHVLLRRGLGPRTLLGGIALLCAITAAGALIAATMKNELHATGSVFTVLGVLMVSRVFGFHELVLVASRTLAFGSSLVTFSASNTGLIREECVYLQGSRDWDELWSILTEFAERHGLSRISLDMNMSWEHENYHAIWERNTTRDRYDTWLTRVPLIAEGRTLGLMEISGPLNNGATHHLLALVAELVESVSPYIERLAHELPTDELQRDEYHATIPMESTGRTAGTR